MLYNIVKKGNEADPDEGGAFPTGAAKGGDDKYAGIKGKISSVGRMSKMFKTLRE